jgi:hypothetical protein
MSRFARKFEEAYRKIREDIFALCEALNFSPTWQQRQLLQAVMDAKHGRTSNWIACKSGQGPGKTTVSAIIAIWRCLQNVDALTIVTAPTMRQCRDVWLVEARRRLEAADPWLSRWFNVTKTKIEIGGRPDWGVKLVTATREENAQGYHQENMTVICEEASGIPRELITQFKGTLSNPDALLIQIGNPNTRDCDFFTCFNMMRDRWNCFTFNAEDTARDYPGIVSPQRNSDLEREFGRDSDVYRIRVLGEFPHTDPNCVLSSEDLEPCTERSDILRCAQMPRNGVESPAKQFGIDFARFGGDESVLYRRSGQAIVEWERFAHTEPARVVDLAFRQQVEARWRNASCWYVADAGGMGQGIMHRFHDAEKQIVEFHNGGKATERDYANKITQAWFHFARKVRAGDACIPKDPRLIEQLSTRQYFTDLKGRLILEKKDDYIKRGHDSPDRADAIVLGFWDDVEAVANLTHRGEAPSEVGESIGIAR